MTGSRAGRSVLAVGMLVVVIAVVVVGGVAAYVAAQAVQDEARAGLATTSQGLALYLEGVLSQQLVASGALASSGSVIAAAEAAGGAASGASSTAAVDAASREMERVVRDTQDPLDAIVLIGADGVCIAATDDAIVGKDLSGRRYVQTVLTSGAPSVGEVITSLASGEKVVIAAAPVFGAGGSDVIGVLSMGSNLEKLLQPLGAIAVGSEGYAFVVDGGGVYVRHPDAEAITTAALADASGMDGVAQAVSRRSDATVSYARGGEDMIAAVRPVPVASWAVVAAEPSADLYASSTASRSIIVVLAVVMAALAAFILYVVGRQRA
jgi:methyl-accepting chemotaxis protein